MIYDLDAAITNRRPSRSGYIITLEVGREISVEPGQFLHLKINKGSNFPYLRRPFSIWDLYTKEQKTYIEVLFNIVGKGTNIMAFDNGIEPRVMLPLGNMIRVSPDKKHYVIVAGGAGIVPYKLLCRKLKNMDNGATITLLFGAATSSQLYGIEDLRKMDIETFVATEDGSEGKQGLVTDLLKEYLAGRDYNYVQGFSCGPTPMLKAVSDIARGYNVGFQMSLENRMGCAMGACRACVVRVSNGSEWKYSRICCEGPNYDSRALVW